MCVWMGDEEKKMLNRSINNRAQVVEMGEGGVEVKEQSNGFLIKG